MSDIITMVTTVGFLQNTKKRRTNATAYLALGLTLVLLTLFPHPCQGQGHGQGHRRGQGYRYEYNRPRHIPREEGTGMAFLMDNWLFGRPPAPISSTTAEAHRRQWTRIPPTTGQEYEIHENQLLYPAEKEDGGNEDEVVTRTYIETNWNEPASLYSREVLTSLEATKSTFTSSTEGKSISSSSNFPSIARELPTSTENNNLPVSSQRTRATQTIPTTSGEQEGSSPTEAEGPEVKDNRNRNRISLTGRRQEVQDDDEKDSNDGDIDDNKKSTTPITSKREVKTTTEASKPPEKKPEEKKKKPTDGDLKLEGGDVEGTGNVIIYRYVTSLFLIRGWTRLKVF